MAGDEFGEGDEGERTESPRDETLWRYYSSLLSFSNRLMEIACCFAKRALRNEV